MPRLLPALLLIAATLTGLTAAAPALADELLLTFKEDQATSFDKDVKVRTPEVGKTRTQTVTVGLGGDYFYTDTPDYKSVYRFDSKRIIGIDKKKQRYTDISLYGQPGFREAE